jgi:hypothetical protein
VEHGDSVEELICLRTAGRRWMLQHKKRLGEFSPSAFCFREVREGSDDTLALWGNGLYSDSMLKSSKTPSLKH